MTTPDPRDPAALLAAYRAELLRWNRQINLLSRRQAPASADQLIGQCAEAFELWWGAAGAQLAAGGRLRWFDLGSGGGLPAFVWLVLLAGRGVTVEATLVEPRAKRAWFLERLARLPGAPEFRVAAARWSEGAPAPRTTSGAGTPILFTLKALRLSEAAILGGLGAAIPPADLGAGARIDIVRFQPATGVSAAGLAAELEAPAAGVAHVCAGLRFRSGGGRYLAPDAPAPGAAGLFVTSHEYLGPGAPA
ncbi:hypothetical protein FJ250_02580 [bacterium]|nr:hypothetical protein [bacterium]